MVKFGLSDYPFREEAPCANAVLEWRKKFCVKFPRGNGVGVYASLRDFQECRSVILHWKMEDTFKYVLTSDNPDLNFLFQENI